MVHFVLLVNFYLWCEVRVFLHVDIPLSQHHLLKTLSFPPSNCLGPFGKNRKYKGLITTIRVYFWTLKFVPKIYTSIVMPVPPCLEIKKSSNFPVYKTVLAILSPLHFYMCFRTCLSISAKIIGTVLNLHINLGRTTILTILTILSLPIHKHWMFFHLFWHSFISVSNVLSFLDTSLILLLLT